MREIWLPVVGYEGLYEVSNWGRVKSLNYKNTHREKILKGFLNKKKGYLQVLLYKDDTPKWYKIHQLVAEAFLPNPNGYTVVHHIDKENHQDNRVENLEWISKEEHDRLHAEERAKTVYQYTLDWKLVRVWPSANECGRNGFNTSNVARCCRGECEQYKGFRWSYELINII